MRLRFLRRGARWVGDSFGLVRREVLQGHSEGRATVTETLSGHVVTFERGAYRVRLLPWGLAWSSHVCRFYARAVLDLRRLRRVRFEPVFWLGVAGLIVLAYHAFKAGQWIVAAFLRWLSGGGT